MHVSNDLELTYKITCMLLISMDPNIAYQSDQYYRNYVGEYKLQPLHVS